MAENLTAPRSSIIGKLIRYWLPVLLFVGAIFSFSGEAMSGENTRSVLLEIIVRTFPNASFETVIWTNFLIRKAAHLVEYAIFAALLYRALRADAPVRWRADWAAYALAITAGLSLLDELRQSLTQTRTGSLYDSLIDTAGGGLALLLIYWRCAARKLQKPVASPDP